MEVERRIVMRMFTSIVEGVEVRSKERRGRRIRGKREKAQEDKEGGRGGIFVVCLFGSPADQDVPPSLWT